MTTTNQYIGTHEQSASYGYEFFVPVYQEKGIYTVNVTGTKLSANKKAYPELIVGTENGDSILKKYRTRIRIPDIEPYN